MKHPTAKKSRSIQIISAVYLILGLLSISVGSLYLAFLFPLIFIGGLAIAIGFGVMGRRLWALILAFILSVLLTLLIIMSLFINTNQGSLFLSSFTVLPEFFGYVGLAITLFFLAVILFFILTPIYLLRKHH